MNGILDLEERLKRKGKKSVLIVDTKHNYLYNTRKEQYLEKALNEIGYSTTIATSEKEALQLFFENPFDIILSEIFLDNYNFSVNTCYELTSKLKVIDKNALVIGMTSNRKKDEIIKPEKRANILRSGVLGYFSRPFEKEDLYQELYKLLTRREDEIITNQFRFNSALASYQNEKTEETRRKLTETVNYLYERISSNTDIVHPIFALDCATGIMTDINPDRKYGEIITQLSEKGEIFNLGHKAYYIKEFLDSSRVTQYGKDLNLFSEYNKKNKWNKFILPNIEFSCVSIPKYNRDSLEKLVDKEGKSLLSIPHGGRKVICEITRGPTIGYIFKKLNEQKNIESLSRKQSNWYSRISDTILRVNLEHLNIWQKNTELINGVSEKSIKNKLISGYKAKLIKAMDDFNEYATKKGKQPHNLNHQEIDDFKESLSIFGNLNKRHIELFSRNLDNSPGNSGWDMRKINVSLREILSTIGLKRHNEYSSGRLAVIDNDIRNTIRDKFVHWDQAYKNSHMLEDVFHIIDSYEANLGKTPKKSLSKRLHHYSFFMKGANNRLNKFNYKNPNLWIDFLLLGYYRNIRKRHLFITKYAVRTKELYKYHGMDKQTYDNQVQNQTKQMRHYGNMALQYAYLGSELFKHKRRESFKGTKDTLLTINNLGHKWSDKVKWVFETPESNNNEDQKISGQFNVMYDVTNKILKSDPILFDKLYGE